MTGNTFSDAWKVARHHVPGDVTPGQWGSAAIECQRALTRVGLSDSAVESAALIARMLGTFEAGPVAEIFRSVSTVDPDLGVARRHARLALAGETHAAAVEAVGDQRRLLEGAERDLVRRDVPEPLEASMLRWRDAVALASVEMSPVDAVSVARAQASVLSLAAHTVRSVAVADDSWLSDQMDLASIERVVSGNEHAWRNVLRQWEHVADDPGGSRAMAKDSLVLVERYEQLVDALAQSPTVQERAAALVRSSMAGNLVVASALTGGKESVLLDQAMELDAICSPLTSIGSRDFTAIERSSPPQRPSVEVQPPPAAKASAPVAVQRSKSVPKYNWTDIENNNAQSHYAAANRRDAGIVAQAALDGDPVAAKATSDATRDELQALVADGEDAVAFLAACGYKIGYGRFKGLSSDLREEARQEYGATISQEAWRWDPKITRWSTWSGNHVRFAASGVIKQSERAPIPAGDAADRIVEDQAAHQRGGKLDLDEQVLSGVTAGELLSAIDALPDGHRQIIEMRVVNQMTYPAMAERLGVSRQAVMRRVASSLEHLRDNITGGALEDEPRAAFRSPEGMKVLRQHLPAGSGAPATPRAKEQRHSVVYNRAAQASTLAR